MQYDFFLGVNSITQPENRTKIKLKNKNCGLFYCHKLPKIIGLRNYIHFLGHLVIFVKCLYFKL